MFSEGNAKIVLVQPNGIPVSDPQFRSKYQYYWAFFKRFNRLHFGINYNEKGQGQTRYAKNARNRKIEFWFLRQDRQPKILMKRFTPGMRTSGWGGSSVFFNFSILFISHETKLQIIEMNLEITTQSQ